MEDPVGFPRYVYKRGTAKKVEGKADCFTADSAMVQSEDALKALEGDWCESPADAAKAAAKPEPKADEPKQDEKITKFEALKRK